MTLQDIVIVICRPAEAGNVGAVCRAMKNMGLSRLRIVAPEAALDEAVVRARAVHAGELWDEADHFDNLADAVADCALTVGTTRRRGKKRKDFSLDPRELASSLRGRPGPAALVFGNERTGLSKPEMELCDLASHIPANEDFPSLNLSHAVQIFAYELKLRLAEPEESTWIPIDRSRLDGLVDVVCGSLAELGFYKQAGREDQERLFRDIFARAGLTFHEARYLENIFRKIGRLGSSGKTGPGKMEPVGGEPDRRLRKPDNGSILSP